MSINNLTIIVPFRNGQQTIERLLNTLPNDIPVIIVDDLSGQPLTFKRVNTQIVRRETRGYFSGAVNTGIMMCDTDVLILNQDIWMENTAWLELLSKRTEYAIGGDGVFGHPFLPNGYCQGTFMWLTRDALEQVGLLNEKDYPLWGATAEWQVRAARQNYKALPTDMQNYGMKHERGAEPYGQSIKQLLQDQPENTKKFIRTPPLVSVIITCYNYGRYLQDAVNSLIGGETDLGALSPQTLQSFEIIIVDDGSKDDSAEIGKKLADADKGIKFIARVNGGSSAAANTGIQAAIGKYITVLDADDMMQSTRLEKLFRLAEKNPHTVIYDDVYWVEQGPHGWQPTRIYALPEYNFEDTLTKNGMHKGIFFEKQAWQSVGGYPERMREGREDWGFNVGLGINGYCGVHLNEPLYYYRRHNSNRTKTNTTRELREYFLEQLQLLYPTVYKGARPMGCCGSKTVTGNGSNGRSAAAVASRLGGSRMAANMIGSTGMVQVEYLLQRSGPTSYIGPATQAQYVFGGSRKQGYVDARDAPALLELTEGRHPAFRLLQSNMQNATKNERVLPGIVPAPSMQFQNNTVTGETSLGVVQETQDTRPMTQQVTDTAAQQTTEPNTQNEPVKLETTTEPTKESITQTKLEPVKTKPKKEPRVKKQK